MQSPYIINRNGKLEKYQVSLTPKQRLARAMVQPLRTRLDYQSISRRIFLVDQLPEGALPYIKADK